MKRLLGALGLLIGAAVAGFFQAGGLTRPEGDDRQAPRGRAADRRDPAAQRQDFEGLESIPEGDLAGLAERLAARVKRFEEDLVDDLGHSHLGQDALEVSRAVDQFRAALGEPSGSPSPGHAYAEVASAWDHLEAQLARLGEATPAVDRARLRVEEVDARLRATLGIPPPEIRPGSGRSMAPRPAPRE